MPARVAQIEAGELATAKAVEASISWVPESAKLPSGPLPETEEDLLRPREMPDTAGWAPAPPCVEVSLVAACEVAGA